MNQQEFTTIVEQYICPVLASATLVQVLPERPSAKQVTIQNQGGTMVLSPR